jgi:hypothetical protein
VRLDRLGGLIHEYAQVACDERVFGPHTVGPRAGGRQQVTASAGGLVAWGQAGRRARLTPTAVPTTPVRPTPPRGALPLRGPVAMVAAGLPGGAQGSPAYRAERPTEWSATLRT